MRKSDDRAVQEFMDSVKVLDAEKHEILESLRDIVFINFHEVNERMMYGGIMFSKDADFIGIFIYKNHVSMEFSYGCKFSDPDKVLEGKGKYRRHLKFSSLDDVEAKKPGFFLEQSKKWLN